MNLQIKYMNTATTSQPHVKNINYMIVVIRDIRVLKTLDMYWRGQLLILNEIL